MSAKLDRIKQGLKTTGVVATHVGSLAGAAMTIITIGEIAYDALMPVIRHRQGKRINEARALNVIALKPLAPHPDQDNLMAAG